jgi:hypothetical protein
MTNMINANTTPGAKEFAEKILSEEDGVLGHLAARWFDEKEYEDITDYQKALEPLAASMSIPTKLVKMTKRPFGVVFEIGNRQFHAYIGSRAYGWKRIK